MNQEEVYGRIRRKKILGAFEKIDRDKLDELIERLTNWKKTCNFKQTKLGRVRLWTTTTLRN